jgi:hypothetical protein
MNHNRPFHFIGRDDATRERLKREYNDSVEMQTIHELARTEFQRIRQKARQQEWRTFWANEIAQMEGEGGNDAA